MSLLRGLPFFRCKEESGPTESFLEGAEKTKKIHKRSNGANGDETEKTGAGSRRA